MGDEERVGWRGRIGRGVNGVEGVGGGLSEDRDGDGGVFRGVLGTHLDLGLGFGLPVPVTGISQLGSPKGMPASQKPFF